MRAGGRPLLVLLAGAAVLVADVGFPAEPLQMLECDRLLDATYDALPYHEKQVRLTAYGGCWLRHAQSALNGSYREILRQVGDFDRSMRVAADSEIRANATIAKKLMNSQQEREMAALRQQFDEEYRALELRRTSDNNAEIQKQSQAITARRQQAMAEMRAGQSRQANDLTTLIRNVQTKAAGDIATAVAEDRELLAVQNEQKLNYLQRKYRGLLNVPDDGWIDQYEGAQPIGRVTDASGDVRLVGPDGRTRAAQPGETVHYDDVVHTGSRGAAKVVFDDGTSLAFSEGSSVKLDEYVYDPSSAAASNFKWWKAVFVFTSGLIGRDDPIDVDTEIPAGFLGIRG